MILCKILNDEQYTNYWMMNDRQYILNDEYYVRYWMIEWWMVYKVLNDGRYMKEMMNVDNHMRYWTLKIMWKVDDIWCIEWSNETKGLNDSNDMIGWEID